MPSPGGQGLRDGPGSAMAGRRVAASRVPSRRPPGGLSARFRGASMATYGSPDHRRLPPGTELIGLRQVDGMAQRAPCRGASEQTRSERRSPSRHAPTRGDMKQQVRRHSPAPPDPPHSVASALTRKCSPSPSAVNAWADFGHDVQLELRANESQQQLMRTLSWFGAAASDAVPMGKRQGALVVRSAGVAARSARPKSTSTDFTNRDSRRVRRRDERPLLPATANIGPQSRLSHLHPRCQWVGETTEVPAVPSSPRVESSNCSTSLPRTLEPAIIRTSDFERALAPIRIACVPHQVGDMSARQRFHSELRSMSLPVDRRRDGPNPILLRVYRPLRRLVYSYLERAILLCTTEGAGSLEVQTNHALADGATLQRGPGEKDRGQKTQIRRARSGHDSRLPAPMFPWSASRSTPH